MDIWINMLIISTVLMIFFVIVRLSRPAPKRRFNGEALVPFSYGKVFGSERLYFGSAGVFVYHGGNLTAQYGFADIEALEKSNFSINDIRVWQLRCRRDGRTLCYDFLPYSGLFRTGFARFYRRLKNLRPDAVKSSRHPLWGQEKRAFGNSFFSPISPYCGKKSHHKCFLMIKNNHLT